MSNDVMEDSTVNKETASLNIFTGGIDFSVPGNGGQECWLFLDTRWRVVESFFGLGVSLSLIIFGYRNSSFPTKELPILFKDKGLKNALLIILTLVLGIEIGFKCATRSLMFLLNPCHITTALQIYMLAAPPSPTITTIFRIHLNFLSGALLALIFPVTNTRLLAFETEIYWIQHFFVLLVPYYLLHLGGVYTAEDFGDFGWTFMSYGILLLYHFTILQTIGMFTWINLNSMVCPAVSDPFYGPYYRIAAICHQMLMVPVVCKLYPLLASYSLKCLPLEKVADDLKSDLSMQKSSISYVKNSVHPLINGNTQGYTKLE